MTRDILGFEFSFITALEPERDELGEIRVFMPQSKYRNTSGLPLNKYGEGPFCQFRISAALPLKGVYAIRVDDDITYIGQSENLSERFNERGYGTIHPRNCFRKGQSTNCRINSYILGSARKRQRIELWFCRSDNPSPLEAQLITKLSPQWNAQRYVGFKKALLVRPRKKDQSDLAKENSQRSAKSEAGMPIFGLTLEKTYYNKGFFNVTVDFDRFIRPTEGPIQLELGDSGITIMGRIDRRANTNGTARIMAGARLRDWFYSQYNIGDVVDVDLSSFDLIKIG